jgi:hypothetical protein
MRDHVSFGMCEESLKWQQQKEQPQILSSELMQRNNQIILNTILSSFGDF